MEYKVTKKTEFACGYACLSRKNLLNEVFQRKA